MPTMAMLPTFHTIRTTLNKLKSKTNYPPTVQNVGLHSAPFLAKPFQISTIQVGKEKANYLFMFQLACAYIACHTGGLFG